MSRIRNEIPPTMGETLFFLGIMISLTVIMAMVVRFYLY